MESRVDTEDGIHGILKDRYILLGTFLTRSAHGVCAGGAVLAVLPVLAFGAWSARGPHVAVWRVAASFPALLANGVFPHAAAEDREL